MRRLLLLILFALLAFYIAWPAISAWQIYAAIKQEEPERLENKIDFVRVRESLRPSVRTVVAARLEALEARAGAVGLVAKVLSGNMLDRLTSEVLERIVTPINMIRMANEPGMLSEKIKRIAAEEMGQFTGGLALKGQRTPNRSGVNAAGEPIVQGLARGLDRLNGRFGSDDILPNTDAHSKASLDAPRRQASISTEQGGMPKLGLSNIKSFGFAGPFAFDLGVSRDPQVAKSAVTVRMAFIGMDWKLTQIIPNPNQLRPGTQ